jgi:hypothetical protein
MLQWDDNNATIGIKRMLVGNAIVWGVAMLQLLGSATTIGDLGCYILIFFVLH